MEVSEKRWLKHYPEDVPTEVDIPNISLVQLLRNTVERYPNHQALTFYGKEITYSELYEQVRHFASALQAKGLKKGDRVAIMLPNCPQYVISYYGILLAGGIVTQINPMLVGSELVHLLNDSDSTTLVIYEPLIEVYEKVASKTNVKGVISVQFAGEETPKDGVIPFTQFIQHSTGNVSEYVVDPKEDIAILQYTGGTTGRSKGAMLTHRNLVANVVQPHEFFKSSITLGEERFLTVIPLFHVFGMTSGMNLSIYVGANNILLPRFEIEEVLQTIKEGQPTIFPGVPTMYIAITNHPDAEKYGIDSIEICNSGSAPLPVESIHAFERKTGATILEGYGLTEAAPTTHVNTLFSERKVGSVGIGVPSTDYKIVDLETGEKELPPGEEGELIIKGPQVMKGYWNMPEETEKTLRNGWLYTGDIARIDEDGYLYIVDRTKDLIIASGYNVYPRDVEEVIYEHPAVLEAAVVGVPDDYRGETVKAVIVLKEGEQVTEEEMIDFCRENIAAYKVPRVVEFRKELPKSAIGKILRRKIQEEHMQTK